MARRELDQWAALNADPLVRDYFPTVMTRARAAASLDHFRGETATRGWGRWAVEEGATGVLIGLAGLGPPQTAKPDEVRGVTSPRRAATLSAAHAPRKAAGRAHVPS